MAQIGLLLSNCNSFSSHLNPSTVWMWSFLLGVTQKVSSLRGKQWFSGTGVAQNPCWLVRSGIARGHKELEPGGTLVKPIRSAPCHFSAERSIRMRTFSSTCTGRLLKITPWRNVSGFLLARRSPALRFTCCPLTSGWKVSGPRQLFPHVHDWVTERNSTEAVVIMRSEVWHVNNPIKVCRKRVQDCTCPCCSASPIGSFSSLCTFYLYSSKLYY